MGWWEAFILGAIQGLTEFLPISSSGHLRLMASFWQDMPGQNALFEVFLHGITLLVVLVVLWRPVKALLVSPRDLGLIALSALPTIVLVKVFNLQHYFENAGVRFVLVTEALTGLFLLFSEFISRRHEGRSYVSRPVAVIMIGVAQGLAVLPGLSRSGLTLGTAFLLGWSRKEAFEFSFLMSLPVIAGALLLHLKDAVHQPTDLTMGTLVVGALPAALLGGLTLILLRGWVLRSLRPFGIYCLALSVFGFCWVD